MPQYKVEINDQKCIIQLPENIPNNQTFEVTIDGKRQNALWQNSLQLLTIETSSGPLNLRTRTSELTRLPDESETEVSVEFFDPTKNLMQRVQASVDYFVPGSQNRAAAQAARGKSVRSPLTGKILSIAVSEGQNVSKGDILLVIEAMKMENKIFAPTTGSVQNLSVEVNAAVNSGQDLLSIK